ncbi:MAG: peptide ABC transporter substrate-binding protein [Chlamydiia bacterium]|nr:peptide ABC transporter substrate-binding protein [Chlamydiia bacterium]
MKLNRKYLRLNLQEGDPATLHPHRGLSLQCVSLEKALYEGLTRLNHEGIPDLALAKAYEVSPCKTIYTFYLRESKWSNGANVTAHHFEAAWKEALKPDADCLRSEFFYPIKHAQKAKEGKLSLDAVGVTAADDYTLVVVLENPTPYFLELTSAPLYSPLYDATVVEPTVFNGPFQIKIWERENHLCLTKNPYYWDSQSVLIEGIDVAMVKDPETALAMYEQDAIDCVGDPFGTLPFDVLPHYAALGSLKKHQVSRVYWLVFNTEEFPFNSVNMRKAISYAIDRTSLSEHVLFDQTPHMSPVPVSFSRLNENRIDHQLNHRLANAHFEMALEEFGLTRETFPCLILSSPNTPGDRKISATLQRFLEKTLEIKVKLRGGELKSYLTDLYQHNFEFGGSLKSALYGDPLYFLLFFRQKNERINWSAWEDKRYQELLELAQSTAEQDEREVYLIEAEKILVDQMPATSLYVQNYFYLEHERVKGIYFTHLGYVDFKHVSLLTSAETTEQFLQ